MRILNILILLSNLLVLGCISDPKPQRDAHGSIIREEQFAKENEYKRRAEEARKNSTLGIVARSQSCNETRVGNDGEKSLLLVGSCEFENLIRLKLLCEVPQGVGVPFNLPMRSKEIQINLINLVGGDLKDPKRFPTKITTTPEGEVEFSFTTKENLNNFDIEISNSKGAMKFGRVRISDPIILPGQFCQR